MNRRQWASEINAAWLALRKETVESIVSIGQLILAAREGPDRLPHGSFSQMVNNDLRMSGGTARKLMAIARCAHLTKRSTWNALPPEWTTLYQLSRLEPLTFHQLLDSKTIRSDMGRGEIGKVLRLERVTADEERVLNLQPLAGKFRTIVLDPAWEYDWLSLAGRAKPGYAMQSIEQLTALDVRAWADDEVGAHLYVWTTNNFMGEATKLVAHWGFQHRTLITWVKTGAFGLGSYFRNSTEHCLFATMGKTTTRPAASSIPTHFEAPRGEHSAKPDVFFDIVRAASYPPYGEGNQRAPRPDFTNLYCPVTECHEPVAELVAAE